MATSKNIHLSHSFSIIFQSYFHHFVLSTTIHPPLPPSNLPLLHLTPSPSNPSLFYHHPTLPPQSPPHLFLPPSHPITPLFPTTTLPPSPPHHFTLLTTLLPTIILPYPTTIYPAPPPSTLPPIPPLPTISPPLTRPPLGHSGVIFPPEGEVVLSVVHIHVWEFSHIKVAQVVSPVHGG